MEASHRGHFDIVDLLLEYEAKPDMQDNVSLSYTQWLGQVIESPKILGLQWLHTDVSQPSHSEGGI